MAKKPARKQNISKEALRGVRGKLPPQVKVLKSKRSFHGPVFDVWTDIIAEPGGKPHRKDVIRHSGSAVILALQRDAKGEPQVLLERQYRHAAGKYLWEIPAGRLDPGETPLAGARRELAEETGFRAKRWRKLVRYYASPGFLGEWMQIFLAEELTPGEDSPDADEIIHHKFVPLSDALKMADKNEIEDAKTLLALLTYARNNGIR